MDKIRRPHTAYAAVYLDDIIIYSQDWQRHMVHLREVLRVLRRAGLMANPKKCAIGRVEVRYLGFHLGHGQVRPQIDKTAAIATFPRPKTKKDVRQFLGLAGYYRRFIPSYSSGFPAWVGWWGYVARGAWFSEVCSGRETQETAVSKWVKSKMRNTCVWLQ